MSTSKELQKEETREYLSKELSYLAEPNDNILEAYYHTGGFARWRLKRAVKGLVDSLMKGFVDGYNKDMAYLTIFMLILSTALVVNRLYFTGA